MLSQFNEIRLILNDQLNIKHRWFKKVNHHVLYLMMETLKETNKIKQHSQKIISLFASMRQFSKTLKNKGHKVYYFKISDKNNLHSIIKNIHKILTLYKIKKLSWQLPDQYDIDQKLKKYVFNKNIKFRIIESEHFFTHREEVKNFFYLKKKWKMEYFYRYMRKKHNILIDKLGKPEGGKWNYDIYNRKFWNGKNEIIQQYQKKYKDYSTLWYEIKNSGVKSFGNSNNGLISWPVNRKESLKYLNYFTKNILPKFGLFQDSMNVNNFYMFHSLLSFSLNTKMLSPHEVVNKAKNYFYFNKTSLFSVEAFIRQILGWREYIRGIYWANMPNYINLNKLNQKKLLPKYFWNGKNIKMNCIKKVLKQSLKVSYAHHIQRLMIIGNFTLLVGIIPYEVHKWYFGIYIDAFEWVEIPNTIGMSQFADLGQFFSKPYVSTSNYINKMSDYCKTCCYTYKSKYDKNSCPYNSLYWNFFIKYKLILQKNTRLKTVYYKINNMSSQEIKNIKYRSKFLLNNLEKI